MGLFSMAALEILILISNIQLVINRECRTILITCKGSWNFSRSRLNSLEKGCQLPKEHNCRII